MSKLVRVRERDPDPWVAYHIPDDLSLPDGWSELMTTPDPVIWVNAQNPNQLCVLNKVTWHYDCGGPGDWIVLDDEGRLSGCPGQYFDQWYETVEDAS